MPKSLSRMLTGVGALVVAGVGAGFAAMPASATDAPPTVTWSVTPSDAEGVTQSSRLTLNLDAGDQETAYMAVRNLGDAATTFKLSAADGYFTDSGRFNMLPSAEQSIEAGTWFELAQDVTVEAGGAAVVPFTITVPDNAAPGDHAAGVAASVVSEGTGDADTILGVESRVGFEVAIRVSGDLDPRLDITGVDAEYRTSWNPLLPGAVDIEFSTVNSGNVQLGLADHVGTGTQTERGDLLPGESRKVKSTVRQVWPLGPTTLDIVVDLTSAGGVEYPAVTQRIEVWAVPWPQAIALAAIALIAVALLAGRRRGRHRLVRLLEEARAEGRRQAGDQ